MSGGQKPKAKSHGLRNVIIASIIVLGALITLIFVSQFVFYCCGGFTSSAVVQVTSISCTGTTNTTCFAKLQNTGSADTSVISGSLTVGGQSVMGTCQLPALHAGSTADLKCTFPTTPGVPGQQFTGYVGTSNGASVPFAGTFGQ